MTRPRQTTKHTLPDDHDFTAADYAAADNELAQILAADASTPEFAETTAAVASSQATLAQIRKAQRLTQQQLGLRLGVSQAQVSRVEGSDMNMMLSTLAAFIEATGGSLRIVATYPDSGPIELLLPSEDGA